MAELIEPYLNVGELANSLGLSKSGIYRLRREGDFPAGIQIGRARRWKLSTIKNWLSGKEIEA